MNTLAPLDLVSLITVLLAMVILAVISRLYNQSWLEPGSFFLVVWFGFIVLPLIMAPENPIYPFSIWYIFSFAVAILLGSAVWNKVDPATRLGKALTMGVPLDRYAKILFNFTLVFTAISIVGVGFLIFSGMGRYNLTFDLFSLSSLPNLFYVDRDTGRPTVTRFTAIQDSGKAIHPDYVEGQMQGGAVQGIGWALNEEYVYDQEGVLDNPGFLDYRVPVASDVPMIDCEIVEVANPTHPYGVRGVGETPIVAPLAAVGNAVSQALGIRMTDLPLSPPRLLDALANGVKT